MCRKDVAGWSHACSSSRELGPWVMPALSPSIIFLRGPILERQRSRPSTLRILGAGAATRTDGRLSGAMEEEGDGSDAGLLSRMDARAWRGGNMVSHG